MVQKNQWKKTKDFYQWRRRWGNTKRAGDEDRALSLLHVGPDVPYIPDGRDTISQLGERIRFYLEVVDSEGGIIGNKAHGILVHKFLKILIGVGIGEDEEHSYEFHPQAGSLFAAVVDFLAKKRGSSNVFWHYDWEPYKSDVLYFVEHLETTSARNQPPFREEEGHLSQFFSQKSENIVRIILKTKDLKLISEGKVKNAIPILEEEIVDYFWEMYSPKPEGLGLYPLRSRIQEVWPTKEDFVNALNDLDLRALRMVITDYRPREEVAFLLVRKLLCQKISHPLEQN